MPKQTLRIPLTVLLRWRQARYLSQEQMAELTGVTQATISRLESGQMQANPVTLHRLAKGLKMSVEQLVAGPEMKGDIEGRAVA